MSRFAPEPRIDRSQSSFTTSNNGRHVFKADANVWEVFIPYSSGFVVFKLLPGLNPEDGGETLDPMILPSGGFGNWQATVPIVSCGKGDKMVSFCALSDYNVRSDVWQTPYYLAYGMVAKMRKLPAGDINRVDSWVALLQDGGPRESSTMPSPSDHTFAFCVPMYDNRGVRDPENAKKHLHIVHLKTMATRALRDVVNYCASQNIDLTDPKSGPMVSMWSGVATDPWTGQQGNKDDRQYKTRLLDAIPNSTITKDISSNMETYKELLLPWSHVFNCPSLEQQAQWCMQALPLDMLAQAWKDPMGNYLSFVTADMARQLDDGCRIKWQQEQARRDAQMSRFSRQPLSQPSQPAMTTVSPAMVAPIPTSPIAPVAPVAPLNVTSAIPGLVQSAPMSYAPVPDKYSSMMASGIPFDADDPNIEKL